uniref:Uncharacterized protein n=1 Tax=Glossina brevipalpis TaxID=37001 RepID=A0A1A9W011_9MUSC
MDSIRIKNQKETNQYIASKASRASCEATGSSSSSSSGGSGGGGGRSSSSRGRNCNDCSGIFVVHPAITTNIYLIAVTSRRCLFVFITFFTGGDVGEAVFVVVSDDDALSVKAY